MAALDVSSMFGPIDPPGAVRTMIRSLSHAAVVLALGLLLIGTARARPFLSAALVLLLTAGDLAAANARFVLTVPQSLLETKPEVLKLIEAEERARPSPGPFRIHRMPMWNPPSWNMSSSPDRMIDLVTWERATLQPKYGIALGVEYTHTLGVAELYDYEWFFSPFPRTVEDKGAAQSLGIQTGKTVIYFPRRGFDIWNTRYFILPCFPNGWNDQFRANAAFLHGTRAVYPTLYQFKGPGGVDREKEWSFTQDYRIQRNEQELPRAWVVHRVRPVKRLVGLSRESRKAAAEEILYANDRLWSDATKVSFDPRQIAWVTEDDMPEVGLKLSNRLPTPSETVKVTYPTPLQAVLDVTLESTGLVVLADVNYPGWQLTIDGQPAKIYRVNQLMRGALVPPKQHRLVFTFSPRSFWIGLIVSAVGLCALLLGGICCARRPVDPMLSAAAGLDSQTDEQGTVPDHLT